MDYRRFRKILNHIVIIGETKKTFWKKSRKFELNVYYTKYKIMIIDIKGVDIDNKQLCLNFNIGDSSLVMFDWVEKNGHQIFFQKNIY